MSIGALILGIAIGVAAAVVIIVAIVIAVAKSMADDKSKGTDAVVKQQLYTEREFLTVNREALAVQIETQQIWYRIADALDPTRSAADSKTHVLVDADPGRKAATLWVVEPLRQVVAVHVSFEMLTDAVRAIGKPDAMVLHVDPFVNRMWSEGVSSLGGYEVRPVRHTRSLKNLVR